MLFAFATDAVRDIRQCRSQGKTDTANMGKSVSKPDNFNEDTEPQPRYAAAANLLQFWMACYCPNNKGAVTVQAEKTSAGKRKWTCSGEDSLLGRMQWV